MRQIRDALGLQKIRRVRKSGFNDIAPAFGDEVLEPSRRTRFSPMRIGTFELAHNRTHDSEKSTVSGSSSQRGRLDSTASAI